MRDSLSASRERERAALDRASVSVDRAEDLSKQLDEALQHLKSVQRVKEDLNLRLTQSLSITAEQKEEMKKVQESLATALKEVEDCRSQMEVLEREVQTAKDEGKTVFALARLTARAAIMRRHLQGKNPLASAKEELAVYLDRVGVERDLDSDDEKEVDEEVVNEEVGVVNEEVGVGENLQVETSGTNATDTPLA